MLLLVCLAVYLVAVGLVRGRGDPNAPSCGVTSTVTGMVSGTVIQAGTINGDVDGRRRG